jgi:HEAT repeats
MGKSMRFPLLRNLLVASGFCSLLLSASETPSFRLQDLAASSDVIAIVNITVQARAASSVISVGKTKYPAKQFTAEAQTEQWIKGQCNPHITIGYLVPEGFLDYATIGFGRQLVFLRRIKNGGLLGKAYQAEYEFTSPYYPSFPVVSQTEERTAPYPADADVNQKVLRELGLVIASAQKTVTEKSRILENADELPEDKAFDGLLRQGLTTAPDADTRLAIISVLISRNDVSVLPQAQALLTGNSLPAKQKRRLGFQLRALRDPQAVPALVVLLSSEDEVTRRGAAEALWHIADRSTVPALVIALNDPARDIRYYAVRALADITGDHEWGPEASQFNEDEGRIVQHWKDWAEQAQPAK